MFDIGWGELVVIGIVALIAIGPKELPTVLRTLGQWMGKVRRMAAEFQGQFQEAMREAEMADLKKQADDLASTVSGVTNFDPMADTKKEMERAFAMPEEGATEAAKSDSVKSESAKIESTAEATPMSSPPLPDIDVPMPELPAPVTERDFAPVAPPPPKQAGGKS
jgi:sec-independent protein translocase protein TatB